MECSVLQMRKSHGAPQAINGVLGPHPLSILVQGRESREGAAKGAQNRREASGTDYQGGSAGKTMDRPVDGVHLQPALRSQRLLG